MSETRDKLHGLLGRHFVAEAGLIDLIQDEKAGRKDPAAWRQLGREFSAIATDFHELRRQHLSAAPSPRSAGGQEPFSAECPTSASGTAPDAPEAI